MKGNLQFWLKVQVMSLDQKSIIYTHRNVSYYTVLLLVVSCSLLGTKDVNKLTKPFLNLYPANNNPSLAIFQYGTISPGATHQPIPPWHCAKNSQAGNKLLWKGTCHSPKLLRKRSPPDWTWRLAQFQEQPNKIRNTQRLNQMINDVCCFNFGFDTYIT